MSYSYVTSEIIVSFIHKLTCYAKEILKKECKLQVLKTRFVYKNYSYPLKVVVFEQAGKMGYFSSEFFELGFSKALLFESDQVVKNLVRHELMHFLAYLEYGNCIDDHGDEYRNLCRSFGYDKEVYEAKINLTPNLKNAITTEEDKALSKVQKLLSLSASSNENESKLAALKAQELLIKYNLTNLSAQDDSVYLKRALSSHKTSSKLAAISSILRTFLVSPVICYGRNRIYLEIIGEKATVNIAEYVAHFLSNEFERLYLEAKKTHPQMSGIRAKNSYFFGLAEGYLSKMKEQQDSLLDKKTLMVVESKLVENMNRFYPTTSKKSRYTLNESTKNLGMKEGKNLSIRQGVTQSQNSNKVLT